jgi:hypothetical protein
LFFCRTHLQTIEYGIVASLYADLRRYQDSVCHTCRENIIRASLATAHPPNPTGFSPPAFQPTALSEPTNMTPTPSEQVQACPTSGVQAAAEPSSSINPAASIVATSSPDNLQANLAHHPTTTTPTVSAYSADSDFEPPQSALPSIPETATNASPTPPNADHPEWSVEYNPDINQGLSLHVTKTFTYIHAVLCTKFSRDGKYLAVGLENGQIHVYNMITGSTRSISWCGSSSHLNRSLQLGSWRDARPQFFTPMPQKHHPVYFLLDSALTTSILPLGETMVK